MRIFLAIIPVFILFSCQQRDIISELQLPPTPILSIKKSYGVVESAYLRVRSEPQKEGVEDLTRLRLGTIVEILSSTQQDEEVEGQVNRWYQIQYGGTRGWVFGSYIKVFDSLDKARNAARGGGASGPQK